VNYFHAACLKPILKLGVKLVFSKLNITSVGETYYFHPQLKNLLYERANKGRSQRTCKPAWRRGYGFRWVDDRKPAADAAQQTKWSQFGVLISVFFFWGFVAASNSIFIPFCKKYFDLDQIQSQLIGSAFYGAYFYGSLLLYLMSYISGTDILNKIGYKKGIIYGLAYFSGRCIGACFYQRFGQCNLSPDPAFLFYYCAGLFAAANGGTAVCRFAGQPANRRAPAEYGGWRKLFWYPVRATLIVSFCFSAL
jgi:hypothetical protein